MAVQRNMDPKKSPMAPQDPHVRNKNFKEVALGHTYEMPGSQSCRKNNLWDISHTCLIEDDRIIAAIIQSTVSYSLGNGRRYKSRI